MRSFSPRDYGGHNQVWTAKRGPDGVMYFGCRGQVLAFDGIAWRNIPVPGGVHIRAMDIDSAGTVWLGGVNEFGYLKPSATGELKFESLRPHLPADITQTGDFRRAYAMPDGVYFQTDAYLFRWHDGVLKVWPMHERFVTLMMPWQGRLVVCRSDGWMMPNEDGTWDPVPGQPDPARQILLSGLVPNGRDAWWAAAGRKGLLRFDGQTTSEVPGDVAAFIKRSRLFGIARLADGRLLLPTLGNGLLITDAELRPLLHLNADNGLPSDTVICVEPVGNGIVWCGTEQGIVRLDLSPGITRFSPANGLDHNGTESVIRLADEPVFATSNGAMQMQPGEGPFANPAFRPWAEIDDNLNDFLPLADGVLAGGVRSLWWVRDGEVFDLQSPSNIDDILIPRLLPHRAVALHLTGIAWWRRDGASWILDHNVEAPRGEFDSLCEDANGTLWIGSSNQGVWRLDYGPLATTIAADATLPDPVPVHYTAAHGLPSTTDRTLVEIIDGAPLFFTSYGLYRHDAATDRFVPEPAFGPRFVDGTWCTHHAAPSPTGGVWFDVKGAIGSADESFHQIGRWMDGTWHPLQLADLDRIGSVRELVCEMVDGEEVLWICGESALIRINVTARQLHPGAQVGATVLHSLTTTSGRTLASGGHIAESLDIAPEHNSVRFRFGTPGLSGEHDGYHVSQLIGFSGGELEANPTGERTFTNLPPGDYVFEARGRTADHHWSTPARLAFTVLAPWWLTPAAKVAYGLVALGSVYLIVRWRTLRLEAQRTQLEQVVAARTAELANKAAALERLHALEHDATLAARLSAETARLELLRYQLNPHFLFNSLNSIRALVYSAPETAGEMVTKLAEFCRRTLNRSNDEMVSVADEVAMARNYLDIEQVRWQDGLQIHLEVSPAAAACELPQNLLLPLLENAIKYGGRTSPDQLEVKLSIVLENDVLTCAVANTGAWVEPDENPFTDSTRIGLANLRQRLRRHYGDDARMTHATTAGWVIITVMLPRCHRDPSPPPTA